jgi:hypothetical protein
MARKASLEGMTVLALFAVSPGADRNQARRGMAIRP